jgi:hypothetical protein
MATIKLNVLANTWIDVTSNAGLQDTKSYIFSNPTPATIYFWESTTDPEGNGGVPLKGGESITFLQKTEKVYVNTPYKDAYLNIIISSKE